MKNRFVLLCAALGLSLPAFLLSAEAKARNPQVEIMTQQKDVIWGFDFLPDQRILFTERSGVLRVLDPKTKNVSVVAGSPKVWTRGQGGLLDVRVHPTIRDRIYLTFSEPHTEGAGTSVAMATLKGNALTDLKTIFSGNNINSDRTHFGSRLEFDDKGFIFVSVGERGDRDKSQSLEFHNGKILRLKDDGSIPSDNPFVKTPKARHEIWSLGHRNPQGLAFDFAQKQLWSAEMGPRGGDELNRVQPQLNYGWPVVTYGREYWGPRIGEGSNKTGMEPPVAHWEPSISPSGIAFYSGDQFPDWKGNLFFGTLSGLHLRRLMLKDNKVVNQEVLFRDRNWRIRNVRTGPDGFLYLSTDSGALIRIH